jgi:hypothetical protein
VNKRYAIGTPVLAAVLLLCGLVHSAGASTQDCISGLGGTGNPSGCTDADRKHYEELKKEADAEAQALIATADICFKDPNAPPDKCPDEYRKIANEVHAASMAKQQREYEIWLQGADARRQEVKAKQEALLKQEIADSKEQYRAAAEQRYEDQQRSDAVRLKEQQAALQRDIDHEVSRIDQYEAERAGQRAQQQTAERQAQVVPPPRPAAPIMPVRRDPLTPAPTPAQTPESRRAAGLPDDPNAAKCIQDDECARALLSKH